MVLLIYVGVQSLGLLGLMFLMGQKNFGDP
jgi:hypothetical protein